MRGFNDERMSSTCPEGSLRRKETTPSICRISTKRGSTVEALFSAGCLALRDLCEDRGPVGQPFSIVLAGLVNHGELVEPTRVAVAVGQIEPDVGSSKSGQDGRAVDESNPPAGAGAC